MARYRGRGGENQGRKKLPPTFHHEETGFTAGGRGRWKLPEASTVGVGRNWKPKQKGGYTRHDVAVILAEFMGDNCACNFNGIDELLPKYCELLKSCPDVVGVACWEQYLKHRNKLTAEQSSVVERRDKHWQLIKQRCVTAPNWPQFEQKGISPEVTRALANLHAELVLATLEETESAHIFTANLWQGSLLELTDAIRGYAQKRKIKRPVAIGREPANTK